MALLQPALDTRPDPPPARRGKHRLLFDHVPKTAGVSITAALSRALGEGEHSSAILGAHRYAIAGAGNKRIIAGHLWFAPGEALAEDWFYCTVLRDPLDRFVSQYWFHREIGFHDAEKDPASVAQQSALVRAAMRYSLRDYLDVADLEVVQSYSNMQAVHFARRMCEDPRVLSDDDLLRAAIRSLEDYDLVGSFSALQSFVDAACDAFVLAPETLPFHNATRFRTALGEIPTDVIERLRLSNKVDSALVDWVNGRNKRSPVANRKGSTLAPLGRTDAASDQGRQQLAAFSPADFGSREIVIVDTAFAGRGGANEIASGEIATLTLRCLARVAENDLTIGIAVYDEDYKLVGGTNTRLLPDSEPISVLGVFFVTVEFRPRLPPGAYSVTVALHKGTSHHEGCYHWKDQAAQFSVSGTADPASCGITDVRFSVR